MKKTIGILAHVDAGKTTFSEQLLYHTQTIRERGRVDHKNAFLDSDDMEKERGITIFSGQGIIEYNDSTYYLLDTPGHVDFSAEMERAIQIMDYAIIIISAVEGVEGHTETVWQLLKKHKIPTFFFINKIDRVGADVQRVIEDIRENLTENVCDITENFSEGEFNEELIEFIAERNEVLLERYLEGDYHKKIWLDSFIKLIKSNEIYPCAYGSALQDEGVMSFFNKIDALTYTDYMEQEEFSGRVFKIRHDENGVRITFIKAMSGSLKVRDEISYGKQEKRISEKVTQIRLYNGTKSRTVEYVEAGDIFGVMGITEAEVGDGVGCLKEKAVYDMIPTLKSKVIFDESLNIKEVLRVFKVLDAEDPALNVKWEEGVQEIHIHVMGTIQLEVLGQMVKERFGFTVDFGPPEIVYKESIASSVDGYGHFEPLGHYAEVYLKIEPADRNSGIHFENKCHTDYLTTGHMNLIRHHIFEREHHGLLTGSSLTDLKITLMTGRAHNKHTSGGDFREATYRALRQGLEKAENILLEPYYEFKIKVDIDHMGRVLSDIQRAKGDFNPPNNIGNKVIIIGKAPVATFMNYSTELIAFTGGRGTITLVFSGYYPCHNTKEVIERIGYNKNADPEYSSTSIFCSKGQSYLVTWDRAEEEMHCLK
ncbi:elongation factor G [Oceanirhabdus sp. W0125-5]|uniref:elongation factor G n=1 Tax=Oceanirhabdus sp. W0125-5 TaxID=2999116 RepID=UPI0022F2AB46|nr:TetM/TetW/TetO/TetS family tetracycline resistance ribosomal protection protein [Oceanirhabdus sp. W0125-5]WBW97028.1 TetM/TetW/TetO/TetS family tetracycline resistance ribosomal protection protein [Oceanirhabdus sp. W0125-5]